MQSILSNKLNAKDGPSIWRLTFGASRALPAFPPRASLWGPVTTRRLMRAVAVYGGLLVIAYALVALATDPALRAMGLGLAFPGGGFLALAEAEGTLPFLMLSLCGVSVVAFVVSLVVWFATGNVLLTPTIWIGTAIASAGATLFLSVEHRAPWPTLDLLPLALLATLAAGIGFTVAANGRSAGQRRRLNELTAPLAARVPAEPVPHRDEISLDDLKLMRLLLDRALQPLERFDGFEWIDQFQTAAVRYQVNFISYALSLAGHVHTPAFRGYLHTAQRNLALKQLDHRLWSYWRLENLWGNLSTDANPVRRDNIMLSGFLAAQLAYARTANHLCDFDRPGSLVFAHPSGRTYSSSLPELLDTLARQYGAAPFGLLACEPNWVYPLCNAITATAIRAGDVQWDTRLWETISSSFRHHLETEFITPAGRLVPFRSSLTGWAPSCVGGAVMQAFPCLFLNSVLPDIAKRQWLLVREDLSDAKLRRALWPVDVGNYGFSRASSYAATAAAAVEMGDGEVAGRLLRHLEEDCPLQASAGVAHRARASLWSHAVELMARFGQTDGLRSLVEETRAPSGPFIRDAAYPDVLVAKARSNRGALSAVLYPGAGAGYKALSLGGFAPRRGYRLAVDGTTYMFDADANGEARLNVPLHGRTGIEIVPAV